MDRLIAIFGDVHANIEALDAVLADCAAAGATEYLCTGDVVGYNASPHECISRVRALGCPVVKGNHDHYVSSRQNLADFHPNAAAVVEWTRGNISVEEMLWLRNLPYTAIRTGICVVHATMDHPEEFGYVFDHLQAEANFIKQPTPLCFHGHTHCPMIYEKQIGGVYRIDAQEFVLPIGRKFFINVGSVGQPRDGDPRASYALYDPMTRTVRFRRLEYDVAAAQERIRMAGLPDRLAERLEFGQ